MTCHICGRERPDSKISVQRNLRNDPQLGRFQENVRYCNDDPDCAEKARDYTFIGPRP